MRSSSVFDFTGVKHFWIYPRGEKQRSGTGPHPVSVMDYSGFTPGKLRSNSSPDPSCNQQMTSNSQGSFCGLTARPSVPRVNQEAVGMRGQGAACCLSCPQSGGGLMVIKR